MTELPAYHEFTPTPAPPLQEIFKAAPLGALDLLKGLLTYNPSKRLSATQALNHTYFTQSPAPTPCNQLPKMNR